jgi:outer membrane receptor protein involved in Fe transport
VFQLLAQAAVAAAPVTAPAPPPPAAAARQAPAAPQAVTSYPASYFAAANTGTALDMVNRLPNFTLDVGETVRGFEGSAGNVLINGQRPTSKRDALDAILQRIPASKVERVDVIRGGAPGIDMQGKTVIANVILKNGAGFRGLVAVALQHVNDGRNLGGLRLEGSGNLPHQTTWEAGWHPGKGADDGVGPGHNLVVFTDGRPPQIADIDTYGTDYLSTFTGALETPVLGGRLRLNGLTQYEKFKEPETDIYTSPAPDVVRFGYRQKTIDTEAGGRYARAFGQATNVEMLVLRTTRHRTTDSNSLDAFPEVTGNDASSDFFNDRHSSELILRGVAKRAFGKTLSLEAGVENADNKLDSRTSFTVNEVAQELPAANVQVEENRTEAFLKGAWNPASAWTVDAALRYEYSEISSAGDVVLAKTLRFAKPRLAVAWTPRQGTQLRFRVEKVVGQLNFDDFVASSSLTTSVGVTVGNPNLNPEQSWITEGAIEQRLWQGSSVELTGRHYKITDVIDRGPVFADDGSVFDQPTNIGNGTKDELAAVVTLRFDTFGWKGLLVKGDVTKRWSEVTDPTTGEKREISKLHPIDWNLSVSQDLPSRHLSVGVDIYGGWRETSYRFNFIETVKIKTYVKPFAEWKPRPDLSLRVEVPLATHPQVRLRDEIQMFDGPRTAGAIPDAVQERTFTFPRTWYVRVRKEF